MILTDAINSEMCNTAQFLRGIQPLNFLEPDVLPAPRAAQENPAVELSFVLQTWY